MAATNKPRLLQETRRLSRCGELMRCGAIVDTHVMKTACLILCWLAASTASAAPLHDNDTLVVDIRQLLGDLIHTANESLSSAYSLPDVHEQLTKQSDGWLSLRHGYLGNLQNMSRDGDCVVKMEGRVAMVTAYVYFQELPFSYTIAADSRTYPNVTGHVRGELCSIAGKIVLRADLKNSSAVTATVEAFHLESPRAFMMRTNYTKQPGNNFAFDLSTAVNEMLKTDTTQYLQHHIGKVIKKAATRSIFSMGSIPSTTTTSLPQTVTTSSSTNVTSKGTLITSQGTGKPTNSNAAGASVNSTPTSTVSSPSSSSSAHPPSNGGTINSTTPGKSTSPSTVHPSNGGTHNSVTPGKSTSPSTVHQSNGGTHNSVTPGKSTSPSTVHPSNGGTHNSVTPGKSTSPSTVHPSNGDTHNSVTPSKSTSPSTVHPSNAGRPTHNSVTPGKSTSPSTVHPSNGGPHNSMNPGKCTSPSTVHPSNGGTHNSVTPSKSTTSTIVHPSYESTFNPATSGKFSSTKEPISTPTTLRESVISNPVPTSRASVTKSKHFTAPDSGKEDIFYIRYPRDERFTNQISPSDSNISQSLGKEISPYIIISVNPGAGSEYPPHTTFHCDVTITDTPYTRSVGEKTSSGVVLAQKDWLTENFNGFIDTLVHEAGRQLTRQNSEFLELPDDEEELYQFQDGSISLGEGDVYGLENIVLGEDLKVEKYDNLANATVDVDFSNVTYSFRFSAKSRTTSNNTLVNGTVSGNMTGVQGQLCILANLTNPSAVRSVLKNFQLLPTTELPMNVLFPSSSAKNMTDEIVDAVARDFKKDVMQRVQDHVTRKLRSAIAKLQENLNPTTTVQPSDAATVRTSCGYFLIFVIHAFTIQFLNVT